MRSLYHFSIVVLSTLVALIVFTGVANAHSAFGHADPILMDDFSPVALGPASATEDCAGGPTIDGILLDECLVRSFVIGPDTKSITVWYTKNPVEATREVDGADVTLQHWIDTDAQAQQVAEWFEESWRRFHTDSGHHLYDTGCSNNVNVQMEDGVGWSGIAYWASSGNCWIGIDSPDVRGGGGQWTVYHEAQHYLQYSYNDGCYGSWQPNYPDNSEFVEGYADLGADSVDAVLDASGYSGIGYNNHTSMYDKSYGNLFNKYFIEQLGNVGSPTDPWHRIDALYSHYAACDAQDDLYVLDTLVPSLDDAGRSLNHFFLDFFAANWAKDWADALTQAMLTYFDDDSGAFAQPTLTQDISISTGSQNFVDTTPDDYAARYYQFTPNAGCPYLQMDVNGDSGALLGINFMAAKTTAPTRVLRSANIGEDYARTFAANGVHNRLVTAVNSFGSNYGYTVTATCVTPAINLLEPRQVNAAMVGAPDSPIAFLSRWEVTSDGAGVRGLLESNFTFDAEGAAVTIVPGTFQAVGDEYWAVLLPPTQPAGTTFVDLEVCLDGTICDTELNALLYVDPGNSDIAMVIDASGSMNVEDTVGEGKRIDIAKRAGYVIADILRPGDRILVTDFSAKDDPVGCGAPSGSQDCVLDLRELLPRRTVADPATGDIAATKTGIELATPREWTPIGAALQDGKNKLLAVPGNESPKHIFLLSDGEENANPLYADVRTELIDSGVVINTIGFGPEAPGNLLVQIAADTGGIYRPVPTDGAGASVASINAAAVPPGQLGLAEVYDYFDTVAQDASRAFHVSYSLDLMVNGCNISNYVQSVYVDKTTTELRFVVAAKQAESPGEGYQRSVQILQPGKNDKEWIEVSPPNGNPAPPTTWDIRNAPYDDVVIIPQPEAGLWKIRSCTTYYIGAAAATPDAGLPVDFMMTASLQSNIRLEGRILSLENNQGEAGDVVDILGILLTRDGTIKGGNLQARIESARGLDIVPLFDDGAHNDGEADDGIYGAPFALTTLGGGYNVRILAQLPDPNEPSATLAREWNGGFWIKGPRPDQRPNPNAPDNPDKDGDGMPDDWEIRCKLDPTQDDSKGDSDHDGLSNIEEFHLGTLPCKADTDNGGENDGSEVRNQRNPLEPKDDKVPGLGKINLRPLNTRILIDWVRPLSYTNMILWYSLSPTDPGQRVDMGTKSDFMLEGLINDTTYYIRLQGETAEGVGPMSQPEPITPKADPDAPSGAISIESGAPTVYTRTVELNITSTDTPLPGAAQGANAHQTDRLSLLYNTVSANVEMRISNRHDLADATWEPLTQFKPWTLDCSPGETCRVYAQFRDAALNESLIVYDDILLEEAVIDQNDLYFPQLGR
jgi:hypothetical protein